MVEITLQQSLSAHEANLLTAIDSIYAIYRSWKSKVLASRRSPEDRRLELEAQEFAQFHSFQLVDLRFQAFDDPHVNTMLCVELGLIEQDLIRHPKKYRQMKYTIYFISYFARKDPPNPIHIRLKKFRENPVIFELARHDSRVRTRAWRKQNPDRYKESCRKAEKKYLDKCRLTDTDAEKARKREAARLRKQKSRQMKKQRASIDYDSMI